MMCHTNRIRIYYWLYPLAWLYGIGVWLRNKLFDKGIFRSERFDVPLICVGNLAVGGTGKTPHTEYLIRLLSTDYQIAVLSRGYKRHTKGYVLAGLDCTAQTIGDEPYQMFMKYPSVTLAVDEDRCRGISRLLDLTNPRVEVILLDDAFQHRRVKPGLSILLTDYHRLFCDDALLPAGRLRESVAGKKRAQIVIVTKCPQNITSAECNDIARRLHLSSCQQLFFSAFRYGHLFPAFPEENGNEAQRSWEETDVLLVTGIASPDPLFRKLATCARQVDLLSFGDHHNFTRRDMQQIKERFNRLPAGSRIIVTTEKDATRMINHPDLDATLRPFVYVLPVEIEILQNQQDKFNQHINEYVKENRRNRSLSER